MVTVAKHVGWNWIKFAFFKQFIAFLMYSLTSAKRKLNKPDRSGQQNIKMHKRNFMIFGTNKLHKATNGMLSILC